MQHFGKRNFDTSVTVNEPMTQVDGSTISFGGYQTTNTPIMQQPNTLSSFACSNTSCTPNNLQPQTFAAPVQSVYSNAYSSIQAAQPSLNMEQQMNQQVIQVLNRANEILLEASPDYPFRYLMYNRIKDGQKLLCGKFQTYQGVQPNNNSQLIPVSQVEWDKNIAENPLPKRLYPYQISSWEELNLRISEYTNTQKIFYKLLSESQTNLNQIKKSYTTIVGKRIEEVKNANRNLLDKLIKVYGILECIARQHKRTKVNIVNEMNLANKLKQIEKKIELHEFAIKHKELKSLTQDLMGREISREDIMGEVSENRLAIIVRILNEQRKGLEAVIKLYSQNAYDIRVMAKGCEELMPGGRKKGDFI